MFLLYFLISFIIGWIIGGIILCLIENYKIKGIIIENEKFKKYNIKNTKYIKYKIEKLIKENPKNIELRRQYNNLNNLF